MIPNLHIEPIKQEAWHIQIKDEIKNSKKTMDKLSLFEIRKMYQEREFLCDNCGKKLEKCDFTLEEHILHVINPLYYWCCEDCFQSDLRSDRIISIGEEKIEDWKTGMQ